MCSKVQGCYIETLKGSKITGIVDVRIEVEAILERGEIDIKEGTLVYIQILCNQRIKC